MALGGRGGMAVGLLLVAGSLPAAEEQVLQRQAWENPGTLEEAARRPALSETLAAFVADPQGRVHIAHGGGARGSAWGHEIRAWLIALGIPGDRIQLEPGLAPSGELRLSPRGEP